MLTELHFKDVSPVTRLDKYDLILVGEVQRLGVVQGNRKVECSSVDLGDRRELSHTQVLLSNQFRPPESELRVADVPSRNKNRAVVDGNGNYIFCATEWVAPERCWEKRVANELGVLDSILGKHAGF